MRAYWYDNDGVCSLFPSPIEPSWQPQSVDQRAAHDSGREVTQAYLTSLGVIYHRIDSIEAVDKLAAERSYKNRDTITVSPEKMGDVYEEKVKMFFHEHLHEDEEIRYIRDGTGFFDVRSEGDEWVRIQLDKDDLIVGFAWRMDYERSVLIEVDSSCWDLP